MLDPGYSHSNRLSFRDVRGRFRVEGFHCHHLIPVEIVDRRVFATFFGMVRAVGFDVDDFQANGMHLPCTIAQARAFGLPLHRGGHPRYNELIAERISQLTHFGPIDAMQGISALQCHLRRTLRRPAIKTVAQIGGDTDFRRLDAEVEMLWGTTSELDTA